jgi:DinB family protein
MSDLRVPSKGELLEALRTSRDHVLAAVRAVPAESLEQGRYEGGWNGRQILAHVSSIEWTYPRLIDIAREAEAASELPTRVMRGGADAYNDRQVAKRAHLSAAELLVEFERNRAATIRAVEAADERLFARPIRSAGGVTGPLATVLHAVAIEHVLGHVRDIVASGRPAGG